MKRLGFCILVILILQSCFTGMKTSRSKLNTIQQNFSESFDNSTYRIRGREKDASTILENFKLTNKTVDSIHLSFDENSNLLLTYSDSSSTYTNIFEGEFKKRGFYEIIFDKEIKRVPPIIPVIYGSRYIYILRIALTKENDLIIDVKWANDANAFLMAAGGSGRFKCYYNNLNSSK